MMILPTPARMAQTRSRVAAALAGCVILSLFCTAAIAALPPVTQPATGKHIAGKFIWFDLATSDPEAAQRFYGQVFGWTFKKTKGTDERYVVIRNEGRPIGGLFRPVMAAEGSAGGRWLSFASTPNIVRSLERMVANGGSVLVPATKVPDRGTHALVRDSQGAIIGLLQSQSGDPPDDPVAPGDFYWVDLYARDPSSAAKSYAELGFEVTRDDVSGDERLLLAANGYARAGILKLPDAAREPGWLAYVQVEDVPSTLKRVLAGGGKVLREPDPAVLNGQFAVIADPQGAVLGVLHWDSQAAAGEKP